MEALVSREMDGMKLFYNMWESGIIQCGNQELFNRICRTGQQINFLEAINHY